MTRLDRRALFTSGAAAALLTATGVSLSAAPRAGGRLRLAVSRDGGTFDTVMRGAVFDTLTEIAPDGILQGALVNTWHGSTDARQWSLELRQGVSFHNGAEFTAQDVVASLTAHDGPIGAPIKRIIASGPYRVELELEHGNPHLPYLLADPSLVICPANNTQQALTDGIGTGLFRVQRLQSDRQFLGQRVGTHYKDGRAGWIDSFEMVVIPDAAVRAEALRDGFVDVAELPLPDGLRGRGDFRYHPSADNMALAAGHLVGIPSIVGQRGPLDDGRIAERWWMT